MMQAMILAAGRGERLRPLTDSCPKPLVEVGGQSLLWRHLVALEQTSVTQVVVNGAWLAEQVFAEVARYAQQAKARLPSDWQWHAQLEPAGGLETAGGIIMALPQLGGQPFWVVNADILTDFNWSAMPQTLAEGMLAHLVLVPTPAFKTAGDFGLDEQGRVSAQGCWTFSGISLLSPDLFKGLTVSRLGLAPLLRDAMAQGRVTGQIYKGYWQDVGTLERLAQARQDAQAR
nr:nucleotidyltransferase family protein [Thiomicrospira sp. ALE5]